MGHRPRVFYGWWVVATAAFGLFFSSFPMVVISFAVFFKPLSQEFHSSRAGISLAFTLHNLVAAVSVPLLAGRLVDRYGARKVILPYTVMFALILLSSRFLTTKMWQLYAFYAVLGLAGSGMSVVVYSSVVAKWFDRRRGLAFGMMMFGLGSGAIIMPSLARRLITLFGWRGAYAAFGCGVLLVSVPIVATFLKERPEKMGLLPDGATQVRAAAPGEYDDQGLSWHEARRSRTFWLMVSAFFLAGASVHASVIHMSAMLTDRGISVQAAAMAVSLIGVALLAGRVGAGYLLDRFFAPYVAACFFGGVAIGFVLLLASRTVEFTLVGAFLIGLGFGAEGDIVAYLTSRYFGLRSFGEIAGYTYAAFVLAGGLGPLLMGVGFDLTGSYTLPLVMFLIAVVVAVVLMTRLGQYRYGVRFSDESRRLQPESQPAS
ncbi:MAG TPA: MFS transporter [Ktedonobacteraceae bacterium]